MKRGFRFWNKQRVNFNLNSAFKFLLINYSGIGECCHIWVAAGGRAFEAHLYKITDDQADGAKVCWS